MIKTKIIPKVAYEKAFKEIVAEYSKEMVKVSLKDYDYVVEAEESVINEMIGVIGTQIHFLQKIQSILNDTEN